MKVLVFIVAYNAEPYIEDVLERIPASLSGDKKIESEILIIDDASGDRTFEVSSIYASKSKKIIKVIKNPKNFGYGGNQKLGYAYAIKNGFDAVALLHGDGQYEPELLPDMFAPILSGQADAVFGSRMVSKKNALKGGMPLHKFFGNICLTKIQNFLLNTKLYEFHCGYRVYSAAAIKEIPFEYNSNGFDFDTDIIIQLVDNNFRIKEIPIDTHYGDEVSHVNTVTYSYMVLRSTVLSRMQRANLYYHPKFDYRTESNYYPSKIGFDSSHSFALARIKPHSHIIDFGCNTGIIAEELEKSGCKIIGIDNRSGSKKHFIRFYESDLDLFDLNDIEVDDKINYLLLMDVIEHFIYPERFLLKLRSFSSHDTPEIIITTANIAFITQRIALLFGNFNYKKRGLLDFTHHRLFTFSSLRNLLNNYGFEIIQEEGIPVPFPLVFGNNKFSSLLIKINKILIKISKGLFSYQIGMVVKARPTIESFT